MDAIAGGFALVVLAGGVTLLLRWLDGWATARAASSALPGPQSDVSNAFSLTGSFESAFAAVRRNPWPMLAGGWIMVILDGGSGGGGSSGGGGGTSSEEWPTWDSSGMPDIDYTWLIGIVAVVAVVGLLCVGVVLALRAWMLPGWIRLQQEALVQGTTDFSTLFSGGDRFGAMFIWTLVKGLLVMLPFLGVALTGLVVVAAAAGEVPSAFGFVAIGLAALAAIVQAIWLATGMALGDYAVALDGASPYDALSHSLHAMRGHRLGLILFGVVWGIVNAVVAVVGFLLLCVGALVTIPGGRALQDSAWCRGYLRARDGVQAELTWAGD